MTPDVEAAGVPGEPGESGAPGEPTIEVLPDAGAVSRAAAERIAAALTAGVGRRGRADWATTGGSSPVGIYRELGAPPLRDHVPWADAHVWWGDDRFVPRDDPLSNVRPFDLAGLPATHPHVIQMDAALATGHDPAWAARAYERQLRTAGLPLAANGFPALDLVLVGLGGDGHILSVFPGSRAFDSGAWVAGIPAPTHIEPHVARVSLHPGFLEAARVVVVIAAGGGKGRILGDVLGPTRDLARWPAQHARRSNAVWLVDEAAAANLAR